MPKHTLLAVLTAVALALGATALVLKDRADSEPAPPEPSAAIQTERVTQAEAAPLPELTDLIPGLTSARKSANENGAIASLRGIAVAQEMMRASAAVDTDGDGAGEYGYLGELSNGVALRQLSPAEGPRAALKFAMLSPDFQRCAADGLGHGAVERLGYLFKVFLPGRERGGLVPGVGEASDGGAPAAQLTASRWASDPCEQYWCAYAWPNTPKDGQRVYFVNQAGDVFEFENAGGDFFGRGRAPSFDAAFEAGSGMTGQVAADAWSLR